MNRLEIRQSKALGKICFAPKNKVTCILFSNISAFLRHKNETLVICPNALLISYISLMGNLSGLYVFSNMYTTGLTKRALLSTVDTLVSLGFPTCIEENNNDL